MKSEKISPQDPRLSAYAFGEMEPGEAAQFARLLAEDPEAAALVEELRGLGIQMSDTLRDEQVHLAETGSVAPGGSVLPFPPAPATRWTPGMIYWFGGLASAACLTFVLVQPVAKTKQALEEEPARTVDVTALFEAGVAPAPGETLGGLAKGTTLSTERPTPAALTAPPLNAPAVTARAQTSSGPAVPAEERLELQPFEVAEEEEGYHAPRTLSGKRLKTVLHDAFASHPVVGGKSKLPKPAEVPGEGYAPLVESGFRAVAAEPTSTFSIDVDTASYANVRRFLNEGQRPPREAVRIEEMINAFSYRYPAPLASAEEPVAASLEVANAPWNPAHRLVRVGLKAKEVPAAERPATNLVFLLDVSGSMAEPNKLPLVKRSLRLLVDQLREQDRVAVVVYAGASGLALPSTSGAERREILDALESLTPGGGTAGALGIQLAYDIAKANFIPGGNNRVILCTDGDFNVGTTSQTELQRLIETKAQTGVFLTVLGFGMGNYQDRTLELLADKGNGNYGYIDSDREARRLLVEQAGGTLLTVARDVKVQVEFNPARVQSYRLLGYENRQLTRGDFSNDRVDAGELGSGHTVTALYEVVPAGVAPLTPVEPLRYGEAVAARAEELSRELLTVAVRYKPLRDEASRKLTFPLRDEGKAFAQASADFRFATAVASFGLALRAATPAEAPSLTEIEGWTRAALVGSDEAARQEFLGLVEKAQRLGATPR